MYDTRKKITVDLWGAPREARVVEHPQYPLSPQLKLAQALCAHTSLQERHYSPGGVGLIDVTTHQDAEPVYIASGGNIGGTYALQCAGCGIFLEVDW